MSHFCEKKEWLKLHAPSEPAAACLGKTGNIIHAGNPVDKIDYFTL